MYWMLILTQCLKLSQNSCRSSYLESQIINMKLKKNQHKVLGPPPKLSASDWRTCEYFQHCSYSRNLSLIVIIINMKWLINKHLINFLNLQKRSQSEFMVDVCVLTHSGWEIIYASINCTAIGSNNGLLSAQKQPITRTNDDLLPIRP